jgi:uncharacterized membrane protein YbhN (UPF0104 family)
MSRLPGRWVWGLLTLVGANVIATVLLRFPWESTLQTLEHVSIPLLLAALCVNLLSPLAKGWAWHYLLQAIAPHRWRSAQEANLVGTAVNSVAAGVTGEAARVSYIVAHDHVPVRPAVLSVVWSRVVEGLGLALFLVLAPFVLDLPPTLRGLQIGGGVALAAVLIASRFRGWDDVIVRLPPGIRAGAAELANMSVEGRLITPTLLALLSWTAEWATYHLALRAAHLPVSFEASFTALIAANVGGLIRITPGNVGVLQAAVVGALVPFGIATEDAIAAGVALQAIQVLPILALAVAVAGRAGLGRLARESPPL